MFVVRCHLAMMFHVAALTLHNPAWSNRTVYTLHTVWSKVLLSAPFCINMDPFVIKVDVLLSGCTTIYQISTWPSGVMILLLLLLLFMLMSFHDMHVRKETPPVDTYDFKSALSVNIHPETLGLKCLCITVLPLVYYTSLLCYSLKWHDRHINYVIWNATRNSFSKAESPDFKESNSAKTYRPDLLWPKPPG